MNLMIIMVKSLKLCSIEEKPTEGVQEEQLGPLSRLGELEKWQKVPRL